MPQALVLAAEHGSMVVAATVEWFGSGGIAPAAAGRGGGTSPG